VADIASIASSNLLISGIRAVAAIIFLVALFYMLKIYRKTKNTTDIWLLVSFAVFTAFLISLSNSLEWYFGRNETFDAVGEQLNIIFSLVWIYIAFRFLSIKNAEA